MVSDPRTARPARGRGWAIAALIGVLLLVWLIWTQSDRLRGLWKTDRAEPPAAGEMAAEPVAAQSPAAAPPAADWLGATPVWPADFSDPQSCEEVESELARVCAALDRRHPVPGGSCVLLSEVVDELARHPPALSSELTSYGTILANAFHLFRVLGRERIDRLRTLLAEQEDDVEPVAMALYRWLITRQRCARSGSTPVRLDALYSYSGFLFHTLGGQAYLRRRSPRTEALTSFYALLILDRAQEQGYNPQGLDPRAELRRTRLLLQAQPLVFTDAYCNVLDAMEERWRTRAGQ